MQIQLTDTGKRFNREWIFRHLNYHFTTATKYAITGSNGSGKSTLLQLIAGAVIHNEGQIDFLNDDKPIDPENHYQYISFASPYLELVEEMTAIEFLSFHHHFKPLSTPIQQALELVALDKAANKEIRYYSSGMKQRLKLAQAFFCNTPVLLLDEPTTNLDKEGIQLYQQLIREYTSNRLVIISSNDEHEYDSCQYVIKMSDYK